MKLKPDLLAAKEWIYPLNRPRRDYQLNISKRCLFDNTLVALPTGLGKTFIAGVVMLNCESMLRFFFFVSLHNLFHLYSLQVVSRRKSRFSCSDEASCRTTN